MNTDLRKKAKKDFQKRLKAFKLMNNAFWKNYGKCEKKTRSIKLVTKEKRKKYLGSEPNQHTTKSFSKNLLAIEIKKNSNTQDRAVYLGLPILELSKIIIYEFWYDYVNQNMEKNQSCVISIQAVSLYTQKQMILLKKLQKMLKHGLILQIMNSIDHCLKEKLKI